MRSSTRLSALLEWGGVWEMTRDQRQSGPTQRTLEQGFDQTIGDSARAYPDLELTPALHIEPRDYQQAALDAWIDHGRRGSIVLPTGSGKTFLGLQAIADAGVRAQLVPDSGHVLGSPDRRPGRGDRPVPLRLPSALSRRGGERQRPSPLRRHGLSFLERSRGRSVDRAHRLCLSPRRGPR